MKPSVTVDLSLSTTIRVNSGQVIRLVVVVSVRNKQHLEINKGDTVGYRSDIYIKVENSEAFGLKQALEEADFMNYAEITQDEHYIYVAMYDLKWYSNYEDVAAVNSYIQSLGERGGLIAIGEDGATQEYGEPYSVDLYTQTSINGFLFKEY